MNKKKDPLRFASYFSLTTGGIILFFTLINIGTTLNGNPTDKGWWASVTVALIVAIYHLTHSVAFQKRVRWSLYSGTLGFSTEALLLSPFCFNPEGWRWLAPLMVILITFILLTLNALWQLIQNRTSFVH